MEDAHEMNEKQIFTISLSELWQIVFTIYGGDWIFKRVTDQNVGSKVVKFTWKSNYPKPRDIFLPKFYFLSYSISILRFIEKCIDFEDMNDHISKTISRKIYFHTSKSRIFHLDMNTFQIWIFQLKHFTHWLKKISKGCAPEPLMVLDLKTSLIG